MAITSAEQAAWQSATQKNLTLSFVLKNGTTKVVDNSGIVAESMSLRQTISDNAMNIFGNVYASQFNVRVFDDGTRLKGATLTATLSVTLENVNGYLVDSNGNRIIDSNGNYLMVSSGEDVTYSKQLGVFEVESDKLTSDGIFRDLVCYDSLSGVLGEDYATWHNQISYPTTIKNYRTAFFAYIGLSQESVDLPNDSVTVTKYAMNKLSGADIISSILTINGCWGYLGMDNVFHYAIPHSAPDYAVDDNSFIQGSFAFEEFTTSEYSGVIIKNNIVTTTTETDSETGETTTYEDVKEQNVTVGDATGSIITMQDNLFLHDKTNTDIEIAGTVLLNAISGFSYTPASISFPPYMGIELGEVFSITTAKGTYLFPVLDRTLSGITGLRDVFTAQGVEYSTENANSMRTLMSQYQAQGVSLTELAGQNSRKATQAYEIAGRTNQYFWFTDEVKHFPTNDTVVDLFKVYYELIGEVYTVVTPTGTENPSEEGWYEEFADTGAHITEIPQEDFLEDPNSGGGNLLARSNGVAVRNGLTDLASFSQYGEDVYAEFYPLLTSAPSDWFTPGKYYWYYRLLQEQPILHHANDLIESQGSTWSNIPKSWNYKQVTSTPRVTAQGYNNIFDLNMREQYLHLAIAFLPSLATEGDVIYYWLFRVPIDTLELYFNGNHYYMPIWYKFNRASDVSTDGKTIFNDCSISLDTITYVGTVRYPIAILGAIPSHYRHSDGYDYIVSAVTTYNRTSHAPVISLTSTSRLMFNVFASAGIVDVTYLRLVFSGYTAYYGYYGFNRYSLYRQYNSSTHALITPSYSTAIPIDQGGLVFTKTGSGSDTALEVPSAINSDVAFASNTFYYAEDIAYGSSYAVDAEYSGYYTYSDGTGMVAVTASSATWAENTVYVPTDTLRLIPNIYSSMTFISNLFYERVNKSVAHFGVNEQTGVPEARVGAADSGNITILEDKIYINGMAYDENRILWTGGYYMSGSHTANLAQKVSEQVSGIILCWSAYVNGASQNYDWFYQYIPKWHIATHGGTGVGVTMSTVGFTKVGSKYVYVYDDKIVGNNTNTSTGTANGITYANGYWVLRAVVGV